MIKKSKSMSILGCGWLGLPLAKRLVQLGYSVKGSTMTLSSLPILKGLHIKPFYIRADPVLEGQEIEDFFESDILFLNIPFKRNLSDPCTYMEQNKSVLSFLEQSSVKWVIFASSTSVYPKLIKETREEIFFSPDEGRSKVLYETEQLFLRNNSFKATVLRFGGLYGESRRIGMSIFGTKKCIDPEMPVNLIHLDDCIEIILKILEQNITGEIFNVVSDAHPSKRELYTKAAQLKRVKPPQFIVSNNTPGKIVSNEKLKRRLDYQFKYPDPLKYLDREVNCLN